MFQYFSRRLLWFLQLFLEDSSLKMVFLTQSKNPKCAIRLEKISLCTYIFVSHFWKDPRLILTTHFLWRSSSLRSTTRQNLTFCSLSIRKFILKLIRNVSGAQKIKVRANRILEPPTRHLYKIMKFHFLKFIRKIFGKFYIVTLDANAIFSS